MPPEQKSQLREKTRLRKQVLSDGGWQTCVGQEATFGANSVTRLWIKKLPKSSISCPPPKKKVSTAVFLKKYRYSQQPKNVAQHLGNFCQEFVPKNFQKSPNLVTLVANEIKNATLFRSVNCKMVQIRQKKSVQSLVLPYAKGWFDKMSEICKNDSYNIVIN